ncbi:ankyrin repeat-containing protein BDA1-like [Fagus crenata]
MEISHEENDIMELYNASAKGCTVTLYRLIHKDPHILNKISLTSFNETPLHISALLGHVDFTKALLALKPQLALELDTHRRCPLHLASAEGQVEIAQALLHANNNACLIRDQDGRIPLHYAAMRGRVEVVRELIVARPDSTQVVLDGGETVLHLCVKYNQLEALKLLVESVSDEGEFLNSKDHEDGNTILHLAVMLKQIEIVKYLLSVSKVKEGVDALNQMGFTALEVLDHSPKDLKNFIIRNILMDAGVERAKNQNNLPPPSIVVVGHHETTKPVRSSNKWWEKWLNCLRHKGNWLEEMRGTLMVVATVITTITFQPIVNPPGGVLQTNVNVDFLVAYASVSPWGLNLDLGQNWEPNQNITCEAGTSVLACAPSHYYTYFLFLIFNTISFTASLCVTFLLISGFPLGNKVCMGLLTFAMCTTLAFLAFAYLIAFYMLVPNEILYFVFSTDVFFIPYCVEFSLMAVIGVVLLIYTIRFLIWLAMKIRKFTLYIQRR